MWTDERVATLRADWACGYSASQIAKRLGSTTRNAVIGKVHRLGLATRAAPSTPAHAAPKKLRRRKSGLRTFNRSVKYKRMPAMPAEPVQALNVSLADLRADQCRAVTDNTRWNQRYCGHPVMLGSCYCAPHFQRFHCAVVAVEQAMAA